MKIIYKCLHLTQQENVTTDRFYELVELAINKLIKDNQTIVTPVCFPLPSSFGQREVFIQYVITEDVPSEDVTEPKDKIEPLLVGAYVNGPASNPILDIYNKLNEVIKAINSKS